MTPAAGVIVIPVSAASLVASQLQVLAAVLVNVILTECAMPRLSKTVMVVGTVVAATAGGPTTAAVAPASRLPLRVTFEVARAVVRWPIGMTRLVIGCVMSILPFASACQPWTFKPLPGLAREPSRAISNAPSRV